MNWNYPPLDRPVVKTAAAFYTGFKLGWHGIGFMYEPGKHRAMTRPEKYALIIRFIFFSFWIVRYK